MTLAGGFCILGYHVTESTLKDEDMPDPTELEKTELEALEAQDNLARYKKIKEWEQKYKEWRKENPEAAKDYLTQRGY